MRFFENGQKLEPIASRRRVIVASKDRIELCQPAVEYSLFAETIDFRQATYTLLNVQAKHLKTIR